MNYNGTSFRMKRLISHVAYVLGQFLGINDSIFSVLCYHSFSSAFDRYSLSVARFEEHLKKLRNHFSFVSLDDALSVQKGMLIDRPVVALTIDDGFADALSVVPLLKKYKIPATFFVLASRERANRKELDHQGKLLSTEQIQYLKSQGFGIGCHSSTHADFTRLSDAQIFHEVEYAKKKLETELGFTIDYFAYPKGKYNERIVLAVKRAGYKAAFSVDPGCITSHTHQFAMPRTIIDKTHQLSEFPALVSPTTFFIRRITNRLRLWERLLRTNPVPVVKQTRFWHLLYARFHTLLSKNPKSPSTPAQVGMYTIVRQITKNGPYRNFALGVYADAAKARYFIKTWSGQKKNDTYYSLKHEYNATLNLFNVLRSRPRLNITVPKPVELIETENQISAVYEYQSGTPLNNFSDSHQVTVLHQIITELEKLTPKLSAAELANFSVRGRKFYCLSIPFYALLALVVDPREARVIIRTAFQCIRRFMVHQTMPLILSHRDLTAENVIVNKNNYILLDSEHLVLTVPGYDWAYIQLLYEGKRLTAASKQLLQASKNLFFTFYIMLVGATPESVKGERKMYIKKMKRLYAKNI